MLLSVMFLFFISCSEAPTGPEWKSQFDGKWRFYSTGSLHLRIFQLKAGADRLTLEQEFVYKGSYKDFQFTGTWTAKGNNYNPDVLCHMELTLVTPDSLEGMRYSRETYMGIIIKEEVQILTASRYVKKTQ